MSTGMLGGVLGNSNAPISTVPPKVRVKSCATLIVVTPPGIALLFPALRAGLLKGMDIVWVGPPLLLSALSNGSDRRNDRSTKTNSCANQIPSAAGDWCSPTRIGVGDKIRDTRVGLADDCVVNNDSGGTAARAGVISAIASVTEDIDTRPPSAAVCCH